MRDIKEKLKSIRLGKNDLILLKNIIAAFSIKGGALVLSLFTMPAYIKYFDNQIALGFWFTVLSVMSWVFTFDLGIGNGLRNKLVESIVKKETNKTKEYISSAYLFIGVIAIVIGVLGYIIFGFIDWNLFFNVSNDLVSSTTMVIILRNILIGILLQFFLRLISSILYAMQKSAINNFISLTSSFLQLLFVFLAPKFDLQTNLKIFSIVYCICINIPLVLATIVIFSRGKFKGYWPRFSLFNKTSAIETLKLGTNFLWVQIMFMILTTTNEFLISNLAAPEHVVEYQVYNKVFTLVGSFFTLALTPLWSAVTKACAEKNITWLKKIFKILNYATLLAVFFELLLIPFLQIIVNVWLGEDYININYSYAIVFAIYGSIFIWQTILSTIVCGMGKLKLQAICYTLAAIVKLVLLPFIVKENTWIVIILVNCIILLPYCLIQPHFIRKEFDKEI